VSGSAATGAGSPAGAAEIRAQHVGVGAANELVERLGEGTVGRVHHGVARAIQHEHPVGGQRLRQLPHEAALARSRLAAQQRQPTALAGLARNERPQRRELRRASDERRGRRESQWAGELLHEQMGASQI
jgi:hypothetical protein